MHSPFMTLGTRWTYKQARVYLRKVMKFVRRYMIYVHFIHTDFGKTKRVKSNESTR